MLCKYWSGTTNFWGAPLAQSHDHFFLWVWLYDGPWQPKLCTKFEVAIFIHCVTIEGERQILGSSPAQGSFSAQHTLSSACDFMMGLGKPHLRAKFEVASPSRCRNIIGEPKIWEAPLAKGHLTVSHGCDFMMDLSKPKLCTKFEVDSFSRCRNIKWEAPNFGELP